MCISHCLQPLTIASWLNRHANPVLYINVENEYAPLSLAMAALDKNSPGYKEKEEDLLSKIEQINEKRGGYMQIMKRR